MIWTKNCCRTPTCRLQDGVIFPNDVSPSKSLESTQNWSTSFNMQPITAKLSTSKRGPPGVYFHHHHNTSLLVTNWLHAMRTDDLDRIAAIKDPSVDLVQSSLAGDGVQLEDSTGTCYSTQCVFYFLHQKSPKTFTKQMDTRKKC